MNHELEIEIFKRLDSLEAFIKKSMEVTIPNEYNPNARFSKNRGCVRCDNTIVLDEKKDLCTNNEPLFIDVPIDENSKITKHEDGCNGVKYWFVVGTKTLLIFKEHCNQCYYHAGQLIQGEMNSIIDKIVQDYEAGLAKEEEKKDEDNLGQFVSNLEQMSRCELTIFNKLKRNEAKTLIFELIEKLKDINNK